MNTVLSRVSALAVHARASQSVNTIDAGRQVQRLDAAIKLLSAPSRMGQLSAKDFDTTQRVIAQALIFLGFFKDVAAGRVTPTQEDIGRVWRLANEFCKAIEDGLAVETGVTSS